MPDIAIFEVLPPALKSGIPWLILPDDAVAEPDVVTVVELTGSIEPWHIVWLAGLITGTVGKG